MPKKNDTNPIMDLLKSMVNLETDEFGATKGCECPACQEVRTADLAPNESLVRVLTAGRVELSADNATSVLDVGVAFEKGSPVVLIRADEEAQSITRLTLEEATALAGLLYKAAGLAVKGPKQ